jgi:NADH dehydrogenase [ubiquinone] 1 alpha subcomplex assembly factor 7
VAGLARQTGNVSDTAPDDFAARLIARIRDDGPISVADYMRACNGHYYATRDPFGAAGDFTTAPEISQVFGELIGAWCADYWQRMGAPDRVLLVELGAGRGTLMADALRATRHVPGFHDALTLHLVETSPALRAMQQTKLAAYAPQFHDHFLKIPSGPMLLVANEFIDALPIMQFDRRHGAWHQRQVAFDEATGALAIRAEPRPSSMDPILPEAPDGAVLEARTLSPDAYIAGHLRDHGGAALIVDYGYYPTQSADTLQAVRQHKKVPITQSPGEVDLTAHVDFHHLAITAAGNGAAIHGPVTQAQFLIALGIEARAAALLKNAAPDQQIAIRSGCRRLIEPAEMGTLFKVLALAQKGGPVPAGFGAAS